MNYSEDELQEIQERMKATFDEKSDEQIAERLTRLEDYYDHICLVRDLFHDYVANRMVEEIERERAAKAEAEPQLPLPENVDWDAEMKKLFNEDG